MWILADWQSNVFYSRKICDQFCILHCKMFWSFWFRLVTSPVLDFTSRFLTYSRIGVIDELVGSRQDSIPLQSPISSSDPAIQGFFLAFRSLASLLKGNYFRPLLKVRVNMQSTKTFSGYRYMKRRNVIFITEENLVIKSITCIYSPCNLIFVTKQRSKNIPFCLSVTPIRNPPWSHLG